MLWFLRVLVSGDSVVNTCKYRISFGVRRFLTFWLYKLSSLALKISIRDIGKEVCIYRLTIISIYI